MTRICTICVRGGSKGLKNKNMRPLLGRPLLTHSIQQAVDSELFDEIAVSSDSHELLEVAVKAGIKWPIERPAVMATDECDKSPAIFHCAMEVERLTGKKFDTFVDLDATAPLRLPKHIREAVGLVEVNKAPNVFSVCPSRRSPYFNMVELSEMGVPRLCKTMTPPPVRRQDTPKTFDMNASIYVWERKAFVESVAGVLLSKTQLYVMPEYTAFDIDSQFDYRLIEYVYPRLNELDSHDN